MILEYKIKEKDINKTINDILNNEFSFSNRLLKKLIDNKLVYLNNISVDTRNKCNVNDIISVDLSYNEENTNIVPTPMVLDILYEDEGMLILNKPAGIPTHPSMAHFSTSISNGVKNYFDNINLNKKIRPVNRLDLNTSGIIIFAKNEYIQECLIKQMINNTFHKEYLAIVEGTPKIKKSKIEAPISRKENSIIERCISTDGQHSVTEYKVLQSFNYNNTSYSLLCCRLLTRQNASNTCSHEIYWAPSIRRYIIWKCF